MSRHTFEDHVGEVRLRVEAPTLGGLFEEAARGLTELIAEVAATANTEHETTVLLRAHDPEALLVDWLNELIFLFETRHLVYSDVHVRAVTDGALEATVRGTKPRVLRTAVKAATLHDLRIEETSRGFSATIVLDV